MMMKSRSSKRLHRQHQELPQLMISVCRLTLSRSRLAIGMKRRLTMYPV